MKRGIALLLALATAGALAVVLVPALILQPFQPQTPEGVALAYRLRGWSPVLTAGLLALGLLLALSLWGRVRWLARTAVVLSMLLLAASAFLARQNHFEWMFKPLASVRHVPAAEASHLQPADMVMGVALGGEAKAYPVRMMAYHHIVNDVVGGEPIVATY